MRVFYRVALSLAALAAAASCYTPKNLNYLQDMSRDSVYVAQRAPELKIQPSDQLGIKVYSSDPQLSAPFNSWSTTGSGDTVTGYVVDKNGFIDFPVLGRLKVEGMTLNEIKEDLTDKIASQGYIKEPVVTVTLDNFDITVLGDASGQNVINVKGGSINLLELLARVSGTNESANIKEVMVVRTEGESRMLYEVNLKSTALFNSPAFYLQQNDIVYVKHRGVKFSNTGNAIWGIVGTGLGLTSTIAYLLLWLK